MRRPEPRFRRAACLGVLVLAALGAVAAPPLPARNLRVEVRIVEAGQDRYAAGPAQVVLGSTGPVEAGGAFQAGTSRQRGDTRHSLLVLNGGRGLLQLSAGRPVDDVEVAWTPWGPAAAVRSRWLELVNGVEVQPRWPGGSAPVTLDVAVQRSAADGLAAQATLLTTVQLPLGEWVDVALLQAASATGGGERVSTGSRQRLLQLRASLP